MYNKNDLNSDISQIWFIYNSSFEYYNCLVQLKNYNKTEFSDSRFMTFIVYTSWYVLIIELCKVFHKSRNQHFNIYDLIDKLRNNYEDLDFKSSISREDINQLYNRFNTVEFINITTRLITLRNKFYAHFDKNNINEINIQLIEIELLLSNLKEFIAEIKSKIFSSEIDFDNDIYVHLNNVLECVEESNRKKHDEVIQKFNEEIKKLKS